MYEFDEKVISTFPISASDQYTSLLILHCRTWILCYTPFAVLSDFEINKTSIIFFLPSLKNKPLIWFNWEYDTCVQIHLCTSPVRCLCIQL